jgi:hypothetical protein
MSVSQEPPHFTLEEAIEAFQWMPVPDAPPDASILDASVLARPIDERTDKGLLLPVPSSAKRRGSRRRWLIPSAAAAVLVTAGMAWLLLQGAASVALADVVKAAAKHKLVRYQQQRIADTPEQSGAVLASTVYADLTAPRLYSESRVNDQSGESILLGIHDGKHHLTTNSRPRTARLDFAPKGYKSLLCCLEEFEQKKGVTHEKSDLDGRPTIKYRHVEGQQTTVLWVDAKTKLPVRLEQESINPSPEINRSTLVWTDMAWDPQLPPGFRSLDELFSTRPPDGYALEDLAKSRKR